MVVSVLRLPMNLACEGHTGYDVTNVTIGALASDEPFGKLVYDILLPMLQFNFILKIGIFFDYYI
jgi:hypothetical protein